jgi:hypothetical protein
MAHRAQVAMPQIGLLDDRREHFPNVGIIERCAAAQHEIRPW